MNKKSKLDKYDPNAVKPFIITVSSRALFDLEKSHKIFNEQGEKAFEAYQRKKENIPLKPGTAFDFIQRLLAINENLPDGARPFEVILLSRNSLETGLRVFNTIEKMNLNICRAIFTSGTSPSRYLKAIDVDLMLSSNPDEVKKAISKGIAAATLMPNIHETKKHKKDKIHIAFDGDSVLFGDESEKIHADGGLDTFHEYETKNAKKPMEEGPFKKFLEVIHTLQSYFDKETCPVRTALVTARSMPAHKRAILTLRSWGIRVDEGMFLGGKNKVPYLDAFGADLFLDDSQRNIEEALNSSIISGHVPYGIRNNGEITEDHFTGGNVKTVKKNQKKIKP